MVETKRNELKQRLRENRPKLLIVCPPCGPFSVLQGLNKMKDLKGYLKKLHDGRILLKYAMELIQE